MSGHPLILYGANDRLGSFHIIAVAITSHEREEDYTKLLTTVDSAILYHFQVNRERTVRVALADEAIAIRNAFAAHFPQAIICNCAVHLVLKSSNIYVPTCYVHIFLVYLTH
ncbi:hypothetical protein E6Q11_06055 [Candidatus Dojkabacteria bacterium]|uniref:MULE transposase domain-containing protein n=1 Tax=Candidatus Dojkabacteria bacterium TaxID=2099670 RepID=A0A5C7J330_9BACT|nr:MAG: hypothetical protein E6Q11_06055 [Candidatus Dojkabacteria bacterium]